MIDGAILVGGETRQRSPRFNATNPATNAVLPASYSTANAADVADACSLAAEAYETFSRCPPSQRAVFLEQIAANIASIGDILIETAMAESGLPRARLEGERGRTTAQLKLFAEEVRLGYWLDVVVDSELPGRTPAPRPDLRRMNVPLGPVAVFGASNFPLAFSVAGGDTASAFAAGCPVVVKGHPAHPGTGELVARAIQKAVASIGLSPGVFSYLPGATHVLGAELVADLHIKAAAFTGSRQGGLALLDIAQRREEPIPMFAEMSSVNPVVLSPAALASRAHSIAEGFIASLTLGSGQFCTNPGIVLAIEGTGYDEFLSKAGAALSATKASTMLTASICKSYAESVAALDAHNDVRRVATGAIGDSANGGVGALYEVSGSSFLIDRALRQEVFGAAAIVVKCRDAAELTHVLDAFEGQLTATLHLDAQDHAFASRLLPRLQAKAGRVLVNGWPTGVEVTHAMVHGGPFPATSDGRSTSVGTLAMMRFLRPVCYQAVPEALLPPPLQDANPWNAPRRLNGARVQ